MLLCLQPGDPRTWRIVFISYPSLPLALALLCMPLIVSMQREQLMTLCIYSLAGTLLLRNHGPH